MGGLESFYKGTCYSVLITQEKPKHKEACRSGEESGRGRRQIKAELFPTQLKTVTQLKYEYNRIISQKVEFGLFRARQRYFESGDKAGKLLARYIKQKESRATIMAVQSQRGGLLTKSSDINEAFRNFYMELYTSTSSGRKEDVLSFLVGLELPTLNRDQRKLLDAAIMAEEIQEVDDAVW